MTLSHEDARAILADGFAITPADLDGPIDTERRHAARAALNAARKHIDLTDYPPEHGYVSAGAAAAAWLRDFLDIYYTEETE